MRQWGAFSIAVVLVSALACSGSTPAPIDHDEALTPTIARFVDERMAEFDQIPDERKRRLAELAGFVRERRERDEPSRLTFICTHNSRRSHMSQIWAQTAAAHFEIDRVETFSGGTEATAFNPRAVAALERAGFLIDKTSGDENPVYEVRFHEAAPAMLAFSKVYNEAPNPSEEFCAVMTCSQADRSCPVVRGAALRVAIPYEDPKAFDGTDREAEAYDERCRQISREMLYLFSQVRPS
jgi:hypothetical protein